METAMNTLGSAINETSLWGEFNKAVPFIAVVTLFAFGYRIIRRLVKGASNGKARM